MGFFDYLDKLRKKNDAEKRIISFYVAFFITLIISIFWFYGTFYSVKNVVESPDENTPLKSMLKTFKGVFNRGK